MPVQQTSGYRRAPDPAVLVLRGDDACEFLNGQVSNDVATLADGESRYALLLTPKGKLRADMTIARDGDETLVICSPDHLAAIAQTIETYRIGFFFSSEDATGQWALIQLVGDAPGSGAIPAVEIPTPLGVDLLVEAGEADALSRQLATQGIAELTAEQFDRARIAAGVPTFGAELDADTFPAEAGLEQRAVSFEKGCYVGQETVARMHYKGHPNRHLRLLEARGELKRGAAVTTDDGRELGQVGTAAAIGDGRWQALAILRKEGAPGDQVDAGGVPTTIVELATPSAA